MSGFSGDWKNPFPSCAGEERVTIFKSLIAMEIGTGSDVGWQTIDQTLPVACFYMTSEPRMVFT